MVALAAEADVHEHEHVWELRAVEYEDMVTVRVLECLGCQGVMFS